ncbi:diguanylate cyclase [Undibacterium fentianense]|uniref:diguanylate cyclase n=1 Tax=Undibacterium fentianense TaxID=2828728 RepID=A0A941DZU8_9BURK|nr:diguanylate cyclase [Undibacterium fentianense]MBR7799790.1 diguanylate cyclase [Undibacterium fentianense]
MSGNTNAEKIDTKHQNPYLAERLHNFENGTPLLRHFSPQEYKAQGQNWAIVQDQRGMIYVGNNDGVLEYDGERWRLIRVANQTTVRSLTVDQSGNIFVGAVGEIGYLKPDASGRMQYVSLLEKLAPDDRQFSDVWRCFATEQGIFFSSYQRLIRIHGEQVEVWKPKVSFQLSFWVDQQLFIRDAEVGLMRLEGKELKLITGGERFAFERIYTILPWSRDEISGKNQILIGTRQLGFQLFDGDQYSKWPTEIDKELQANLLYSAAQLSDGHLAFGTIQGGLYIIDRQGHLLTHLDKTNGLPDQAVYGLKVDQAKGLWVALDRGLLRIEVSSPLTKFNETNGLVGSTLSVHRHQGRIYASTTQGLYQLKPGPDARFERVPGVDGPTWSFLSIGDTLLIANYQGVYEIQTHRVNRVLSADAAFSLAQSKKYPDFILVGLRSGLAILHYKDGHWQNAGSVPGIKDEIRTIQEDTDGRIWVGTNASGILRISQDKLFSINKQPQVERFGVSHGLPNPNKNWVYWIQDKIRFATAKGVMLFDEKTGRFMVDPLFEKLFSEPRPVFSLYEDKQRGIWMFSQHQTTGSEEVGIAKLQANGRLEWDSKALSALFGERAEGMMRILSDQNGVIWLGGSKGLFHYDPQIQQDYQYPFAAMIRNVSKGDTTIFGGEGQIQKPALAYQDNRLRFDYAAPNFNSQKMSQFQVFLEGNDEGWSDWTSESYRDYSNLYEGNYQFRVRAKNHYGTISQEAVFAFSIQPPWYRTIWAYLFYAACGGFILFIAVHWRLARLRRQKLQLEQLITERTAELQHAYAEIEKISLTDPLTGLGNRRFFTQQIEQLEVHPLQDERRQANASRLAFVMLDIDYFKQVNDRFGHAAGDTILTGFAEILRQHCRKDDLAIRWGGEEFLLCAKISDEMEALLWASRLRKAISAAPFNLRDGMQLSCTCSIGIACFPFQLDAPDALNKEDIIGLADMALYLAKQQGRNRCIELYPNKQVIQHLQDHIPLDFAALLNSGMLLTRSDLDMIPPAE